MKIFAVGFNYSSHIGKIRDDFEAADPVLFMKPDTALLKDGKPFFIPDFSDRVEYEAELVLKICRLGKNISERFAHRYYDEITIGIDFTARDIQYQLEKFGAPWEIAKGFDSSAAIGTFIPLPEGEKREKIDFHLDLNGKMVQKADTSQMIHSFDRIVSYISRFFTLKIGDLIFTGTPAGVGKIEINDHLEGYIKNRKLLDFKIK